MKKKAAAVLLMTCIAVSLAGCKKEIPVAETATTPVSTENVEGTNAESDTQKKETLDLTPEEGAELTFWTTDLEFGEAAAEKFEELYNITVKVEEGGLDAINKMMLDGPAGNGADLFMAAHDSFTVGQSAGLFLEMNETIASSLGEELSPVAVKTVTKDGKMYGVPLSIETNAMLYNKDLVKEPASTFEQIREESKTFTDAKENKYWFLTSPNNGYPAYPFLSACGFQLFGADGTDDNNPGFNTPEFTEGLKVLASLKEMIPIKSDDLSMANSQFLDQSFIDGNVGYFVNGPWVIKSMLDAGVNLGVAPLPTYDGKVMTPFAGVQNIHVSAYSKYPVAAQLFAQYLTSNEASSLLYEKANKITSRKEIDAVEGLCDDANMKVFADQFQNAVPMPTSKRISYYWTITEGVLGAVFDGTLSPEDGSKKAQEDFEALVKSE